MSSFFNFTSNTLQNEPIRKRLDYETFKLLKAIQNMNLSRWSSCIQNLEMWGFYMGVIWPHLAISQTTPDYTKEERCKINLLIALYAVHSNTKSTEPFEKSLLKFYKEITLYKSTFIRTILGNNLESILHKRIHIDNNILTKNFQFFCDNALLFMDVMAYQEYLKGEKNAILYLNQFENSIRTLVLTCFKF